MSKGHGSVMRAVLARLADGKWHDVIELPHDPEVEYDALDRAAEESYRRACKRLAAMGLVELGAWDRRLGLLPDCRNASGRNTRLVVRKR